MKLQKRKMQVYKGEKIRWFTATPSLKSSNVHIVSECGLVHFLRYKNGAAQGNKKKDTRLYD